MGECHRFEIGTKLIRLRIGPNTKLWTDEQILALIDIAIGNAEQITSNSIQK
jgi:hypothetical protein